MVKEEKMTPTMVASLDLSSLMREDSTGGQSITVSSNLQIEDFKFPVTKLEILYDGSFICLIKQKLVRYSHGGEIITEFEPPIPPRNFLVRNNGWKIVVIDEEGIKVYDENFRLLTQVPVNTKIINLAKSEGLAEDKDGNLATIIASARESGITDENSCNIFIIDVVTGQLNRSVELKPLYEAVALSAGASPTKSCCEFIALKNGVIYVVGL